MSKQTTDTDVAFISALAELLNKNNMTELSDKREYGEDDSLEVRVVKQATVVTMAAPAPTQVIHHAAAPGAVSACSTSITRTRPPLTRSRTRPCGAPSP